MSMLDNRQANPLMVCKVVFTGDSGVGKTSLLNRQTDNVFFEKHLSTIGVDFKIKTYDLGILKVKAQLWDTAGQERFKSIQKPYYKNASAICLCFDLSRRQTFNNLEKWIEEMLNFDVPTDNMVLVGCKSDLDIEVATDQILLFAQEHKIQYHQTSARDNEGVGEMFNQIMIQAAQKKIAENGIEAQSQIKKQKEGKILKEKEEPLAKKRCC